MHLGLIALTLAAVAAVTLAAVGSIARLTAPAGCRAGPPRTCRRRAPPFGTPMRPSRRLTLGRCWRRRRSNSMQPAGCSPEPRWYKPRSAAPSWSPLEPRDCSGFLPVPSCGSVRFRWVVKPLSGLAGHMRRLTDRPSPIDGGGARAAGDPRPAAQFQPAGRRAERLPRTDREHGACQYRPLSHALVPKFADPDPPGSRSACRDAGCGHPVDRRHAARRSGPDGGDPRPVRRALSVPRAATRRARRRPVGAADRGRVPGCADRGARPSGAGAGRSHPSGAGAGQPRSEPPSTPRPAATTVRSLSRSASGRR